jgi:NTE family protein
MAKPQATRQTVLVLQGGGALGAYQGGAFAGLVEHGVDIDWVVGTSIGAIAGAIIAGNKPEQRVKKLQGFWDHVASEGPSLLPYFGTVDWLRPWTNATRTLGTLVNGIPGFFRPRQGSVWDLAKQVPAGEASFYDTSPLEATLNKFVNFGYLNEGHMRLTVCAVNVANGELEQFDNADKGHKTHITAKHVMASGALPPGFPPVQIGEKVYWDGGIYSNTPIDIVLDDANRRDTLCFMIDLWDPTENVPDSIAAAITRQKDIQYASRSREHLDDHRTMQNLRRAIRTLAELVPAKDKKLTDVQSSMKKGCASSINIVRLVMKARPEDDHMKDIDFARETLTARWQAGANDAARAMRHKSWLKPLPPNVGMVIHELSQE